jgi:putative sigma-54 modulation protein
VQINISARHGQLGQETKDKINSKLQRLVRFHERMTAVDVTVDLEHEDEAHVEIRVSVERAKRFVARTKGPELMGALDGAIHKLEEQLRRHKNKLVEHRSTGRRTVIPQDADEQQPE